MAVIYVRTSTVDKQDTAMQKRDLESHAELKGIQIEHIYEDKGYTGTNTKRPGLQSLLSDAREGKFDTVLVWKFDRFARSLTELLDMIKELDKLGIQFISLMDHVDLSTSQGRLMMHLLGAFAQFESDLIKTRVKAGMNHAKKYGTRSGKAIGKPKKRDDNKIMQLRTDGLTIREIAKELECSKGSVQAVLKAAG